MKAAHRHQDPSHLLDPWCRALLAQAVRRVGCDPNATPDVECLSAAFAASAKFRPLLAAYADLLRESTAGDAAGLRDTLLKQEPALAAHVSLAETCVAALPEILAEKQPATEVLFPNGSLSLVEPIYRDNPWADYFNRLTAEACLQALQTWRTRQPERRPCILEIGAGTGATTGFVLERLAELRDVFDYLYTDLSPGFVQHGKQNFGDRGYRMRFLRLDIEQDPAVGPIPPGSADIVIATNVLHATHRIEETLAHVRALTADDGLLLLNELTRADAFAALTFGLLDGWWRFDDAGIRLPHAPILPAAGWCRALLENGFSTPAVYGWNGEQDAFQCLFVSAASQQAGRRTPATASLATTNPQPQAVPAATAGDDDLRQIRRVLAKRLGFAETEIAWDRPFAEMGVDSIVAPQFAADLSAALHIDVDAVDIYNHGSVAMLAEALSHRLPSRPAAAQPMPAPASDLPDDAIAVIGLACRFAGAPNADTFWTLLENGEDAIAPLADQRWSNNDLTIHAGLLPDADRFDPEFFRISHAEAEVMDPQQRVFLEECWHALEDAGLTPETLEGQACGVFVGVAAQNHPANNGESRAALGNSNAILAARIAYHLNLKGPAVPVDTACSSSLVAIHLAASALRNGDCDIALAGGVSVLLCNDSLPRFLVEAGMVSPSGCCRAFDGDADGFVPGEGVGVLVLRRLDRALAAGNRILGVIRASGINQDGRTSGITAPSGPAQTALLQQVWARAAIDPCSLTLIEAHGTGTPLGDPIEVQSLTAALAGRKTHRPCALGSVKPNIGHTLTAAGVAGVIKVLLALKHCTIPPSPHFSSPNPRLKLDESPFHIPTRAEPWSSDGPRRAAVSSFGFSGTNAHVLIEEPPVSIDDSATAIPLLLLSAADPGALQRTARNLADWLERHPDTRLSDLNRTLNAGRAILTERAALLAGDPAALRRALQALAEGRNDPALLQGRADPNAGAKRRHISPNDDLNELAAYFVSGGAANWESLAGGGKLLSLPGYPFTRDHFPLPSAVTAERTVALQELLPADDPVFSEHCWDGRAIVPATALLLLAANNAGAQPCLVREVSWSTPLPAGNRSTRLRMHNDGRIALDSDLGRHGQATVASAAAEPPAMTASGNSSPHRVMTHTEVYRQLTNLGFEYGPAFRVIRELSIGPNYVSALLDWQPDVRRGHLPAIALLDGMVQAAIGLLGNDSRPETVIPVGLQRAWLDIGRLTAPLHVEVRENPDERQRGQRRLSFTARNAAGATAALLENLTVRIAETAAPVEPLYYRPVWHRSDAPSGQPDSLLDRVVLLFAHAESAAEAFGSETVAVLPGPAFRHLGNSRYQLRPGSPEDLVKLAQALNQQGFQPDLWIDAWPLNTATDAEPLTLGPLTLLYGLAAWLPLRDESRLLSVVQISRADNPAAADADPAHAGTAALLRSLADEEPRFTGKVIALAKVDDFQPALAAELDAADGAVEIVRGTSGERFIRAYESAAAPSAGEQLQQEAVCLITGGFGGLGLALAQHLWQTRRAKLALLGRNSPGEAARRTIVAMQNDGAAVLEIRADISDANTLRGEIAAIKQQWGRLDAVFHLAGVQQDGFLRGADREQLDTVLKPKITGTQALLTALDDTPDALLVAFGSLAGAFGAPGQAPYALANRAMMALLEQASRRRRILQLDWGYWDPASLTGGMVNTERDKKAVGAATGLLPFTAEQALAMLERVLGNQGRWLLAQGRRPAFEAFLAAKILPAAQPQAAPVSRDIGNADAFLAYLTDIVADITHTPKERLKPERALDEFGIDSIMVTRLNTRLEQDLGLISKTLFYEYPNLRALARHLAEHHAATTPAIAPESQADRPSESADTDAIAVIGMASRFPQAGDIDAYWRNLLAGRICIDEIPPDRWPLEGFFDPEPGKPGLSYSKWGGFIDGVDRFDPLFFNIAPDEAARMDPQERLFLEVAWQCLEDAGLKRADLGPAGERDVGVYVGVMYGDYQLVAHEAAGPHSAIGGAAPYWSIANRVSYTLGLEGPSLAVDSACSSSLTALHLACQAIADGDCRAALVGGVNLTLHPGKYIGLSQGRFASSDGLCRSFVADGDGYVPGEGVAAVLLKPLTAAIADGDPVHGVILASATNHGGRTNGYTVPSPAAQAAVIRRALKKSRLPAGRLGYLEAHGTGTRLGDPIEIEGLQQALGPDLPSGSLPLGSAKASIGHLEAAAGLAGLIKVVLQMRHGRYAPLPMAGPVNPNLDLSTGPLRLQIEAASWPPDPDGHRVAGVSSFGAGGANAHVIIQDAPPQATTADDGHERVIPLSARTREQVRALAKALATHLDHAAAPPSLADLCHTLTAGREAMRWRCAFVAGNVEQARRLLQLIGDGREADAVFWGEAPDDSGDLPADPHRDDLPALAQHWCQGGAALWPQHGVRLPLAARPFLGGRYWLKTGSRSVPPAKTADWIRASRPLQENECGGWIFTVAPDSTLLRQHLVGGEALLPGAAIAAMALEIDSGELGELNWLSPVTADDSPLRLDFSLRRRDDGIAFSVRRLGSPEPGLVASGLLGPPSSAPFEFVVPKDGETIPAAEFYRRLERFGLHYGPRFQVLRQLWPHNEQTCAELQPLAEPTNGARIDPVLLDGAFQSLAGLMGDWDETVLSQGIPVPHTLRSLTIFGDPNRAAQVFARRRSAPDAAVQRFQLALADDTGRILLQVGELTARRRAPREATTPITLLKPLWTHHIGERINPGRSVILAAPGSESLSQTLSERLTNVEIQAAGNGDPARICSNAETLYYLDVAAGTPAPMAGDPARWAESASERALRLLAVLRNIGSASTLQRILIVTRAVHAVHASPAAPDSADAAALQGLAKVAAREMPNITVIPVDMPAEATDTAAVERLASEAGDSEGAEVAYRHGRRLVRRLQALEPDSDAELPLKTGGVCLIVGGNGGVGRTLAAHWAEKYQARVAMVGRKASDAGIEQFLAGLRASGGDGVYLQADATDPAALANAIEHTEILFGPVELAVHGALALCDTALARMQEADFRTAFAPRAAAGAALLAGFANRPPPLFLFFSSANLFLGQHGQGNYVAGNAALAALHQAALAQKLPSRLLHWGLWGEIGAVADSATQERFAAEGILPISPDMGAAILPKALAAGSEIAAVRIAPSRLAHLGLLTGAPLCCQACGLPAALRSEELAAGLATVVDAEIETATAAFLTLESYGLLCVTGVFRVLTDALQQRRVTTARLLRELEVVADYRRLVLTLLSRLAESGLIDNRDGLWCLPAAEDLRQQLDEQRARLDETERTQPWLRANRNLLEHCLDAYADVIQGRVSGASVLFPGGSGEAVAAAYRGNPVSDRANALLCQTVAAEVESRLQVGSGPVRILEVGAGTGGSTLPLLDALRPWQDRIEYRVTDLSPMLANSLRERCAEQNWKVEASALDIGNLPEAAERSRYDVIIAANVVHASADANTALSHLRARLIPGGRLAMIELTASRDLGTLIFGLTPQWWEARDADARVPDGPAIRPPVWLDLLSESGFTEPLLVGVDRDPNGSHQSLISAVADQWVARGEQEPKPEHIPVSAPQPQSTGDRADTIAYLKSIFSAVLGVDPDDMRDGDTFERYGVESLSALEIRNRIAVEYPGVSSTLLFEHGTLQRLAEHLSSRTPAAAETNETDSVVAKPEEPADKKTVRPPSNEAIAVIGFAGRFPGAATPEALWELVRDAGCAIGPVPSERWEQARYFDTEAQGVPSPGRCRSRWGGFLADIDRFDPLFFGIAPLEADTMDPQERLFIETCWQALEDAGTTPARLNEQARSTGATGTVGVFCGVMNTAYQWLAAEAWRTGEDQAASSHFWSIPNRVSYLFDFDGPSLAVDTACSSSLTALHLACESLRRGECGAALAGGVNLIAHPRQLVNLGQAGMISNGAECRAFAAGADGFVDGEGVGVALLKPLSRALADGDRIDGLIVGSAVNAGGKTGGFTVPSPRAQSAVIRAALTQAGVKAADISLIETHGTGTELGDPIEIAGLLGGLPDSLPQNRMPLGTLKANIGHLESAAGIASLIKVLLQLRHETIAPARHAAAPNPLINWKETPFRLPGGAEPWPKSAGRPRRAAISGFGAGGANTHLVIEEAPATRRNQVVPLSPEIIPLSARNAERLPELAEQMAAAIAELAAQAADYDPRALLADVGRTLREGRVEQAHCVRIEAHDLDELLDALRRLASSGTLPATKQPPPTQNSAPNARPLSLPNTPFDRRRHWLNVEPAPPGGIPVQAETRTIEPPSATATLAAQTTCLLQRRWKQTPALVPPDKAARILLVGGSDAMASELRALGHDVECLSATNLPEALSKPPENEFWLAILDARNTPEDAAATITTALTSAQAAVRTAVPFRVLHVAPFGADGRPLPASFAVASLLRSLSAEAPDCRCGTLTTDLSGAGLADAIAEESNALSNLQTRQIQRRARERRQIETICPAAAEKPSKPLSFRSGGHYVLAGGGGEVGRALADTLTRRHHATATILGRRPVSQVAPDSCDGRIDYRCCDINDAEALNAALEEIVRVHGSIDGVLHLARQVTPSPLYELDIEHAAASLAPKVGGSINLLRALAPHRPAWLIFFSSLAAWAGQAGGADYAAACGFQDGLAANGGELPLLSIAWPQWQYDAFLNDAKREALSELGLAALDAATGLDGLERLLACGPGAYSLLQGDAAAVETLVRRLCGDAQDWAIQLEKLDAATLLAYRDYLRDRLADRPFPGQAQYTGQGADDLSASVLAICSDYLKIPPAELACASFAELGLDSIRALHLAERLQRRLKRIVEPVMLFENPTVADLSSALAKAQEAP